MAATATATRVQFLRTDKVNLNGEFGWFILPEGTHDSIYSPQQAGDSALKACFTWLESNGYKAEDELKECYSK